MNISSFHSLHHKFTFEGTATTYHQMQHHSKAHNSHTLTSSMLSTTQKTPKPALSANTITQVSDQLYKQNERLIFYSNLSARWRMFSSCSSKGSTFSTSLVTMRAWYLQKIDKRRKMRKINCKRRRKCWSEAVKKQGYEHRANAPQHWQAIPQNEIFHKTNLCMVNTNAFKADIPASSSFSMSM